MLAVKDFGYILLLSPLYKYGTWSSEKLIRNWTKITKLIGAELDLELGVYKVPPV